MEVYAQEITATCDEGSEKNWGHSGILLLVSPESILMGSTKTCGLPADLKGLCVVLEKSQGIWAVV